MNEIMLYGGLGNQMFQYALYLAMREKGIPAKIMFLNFFFQKHHNGFNLNRAFKLNLPFPSNIYSKILSSDYSFQRLSPVILNDMVQKSILSRKNVYREKSEFHFDAAVFDQRQKLIVGTWQSEKYFKDIQPVILDSFTFNVAKDVQNLALSQQITESNAVSVHVRRGDYFTGKWAKTHSMQNQIEYYTTAIEKILDRVENPKFFVFSDDPKWVINNLNIPSAKYVDHNTGKNAFVDMYLMTLCKHNIIANSTFSWWGAWLNRNKEKIVISPRTWLNERDCEEIYNELWLRI